MGAGFAQGGVLDELPAGPALAGFADEAYQHADDLDDDTLIGLLRAHDRQSSHQAARKLALIARLARRRPADRTPPPAPGELPEQLSEFFPDEIAVALTLTRRGAATVVALALELDARPAIAAALEAGRIDLYKARILVEALAPLGSLHAAAVQAAILPAAAGLTSGQLRAELARAVLALDPEAMRKRREKAEKDARVELWTDPDGTATLAGRNLPPAEPRPLPIGSASRSNRPATPGGQGPEHTRNHAFGSPPGEGCVLPGGLPGMTSGTRPVAGFTVLCAALPGFGATTAVG